ncbi:hypothetical protein [Methylopila sp. 73B]|uniref:hypothetical protein n=1 Tax=Methylopila sp. 73B TaxID=1120792 RepID=UPI00036B0FE5|nr:hypothetical protein [Methylopila sp. 73B]
MPMTRLAGRLMFAIVLQIIATNGVRAADAPLSSGFYAHGGVDDRCGPPEIVKTKYKEQICYAGESGYGYAACRWVKRTYAVRIPAECARPPMLEDAYRIERPRHERALSTKG